MELIRPDDLARLDFERTGGLIPVVALHADTGELLMLAWADREALRRTLETGEAWYFSRSRQRLWRKGESSGNVQRVVSLHADCDGDAVVALVLPAGPACHTGAWSCFAAPPTLPALAAVIDDRARQAAGASNEAAGAPPVDPAPPAGASYTARLLEDRNLRLKKLGEEALELALACADAGREPETAAATAAETAAAAGVTGAGERVAEEAADLLYHLLVACRGAGVGAAEVLAALRRRLPAGL
jgi:phosphoribosyl-AMP cyclohydrolase / phosphoribosyl-ATP pyrophosphohydrolase